MLKRCFVKTISLPPHLHFHFPEAMFLLISGFSFGVVTVIGRSACTQYMHTYTLLYPSVNNIHWLITVKDEDWNVTSVALKFPLSSSQMLRVILLLVFLILVASKLLNDFKLQFLVLLFIVNDYQLHMIQKDYISSPWLPMTSPIFYFLTSESNMLLLHWNMLFCNYSSVFYALSMNLF